MPSKSYLLHINGLRAIAILAVLLYHLNSTYCPAGYFGVDLFLVISGFLLFRKLMDNEAAASFRYGEYLTHKAWRILPSWFILTLSVVVVSILFMEGSSLTDCFRTARQSAFLLADFRTDRIGDYFNHVSLENPLLHIWYLSLICQLYILAPLLTIPLVRRGKRRLALAGLIAIGLLSLAYWILTTTNGIIPENMQQSLLKATATRDSYYHLIPRMWEILAGFAILFLPELAQRRVLRSALAFAGLSTVLASFYLYQTGSRCTYMAVVGAMAVIRYGNSGIISKLLSWRPVQFLGTISFSLYLWHWPVMAVYKYVKLGFMSPWDEVVAVIVSLVLGCIAWKLVEKGVSMPRQKEPAKHWLAKYAVLLTLPGVFLLALLGRMCTKHAFEDEISAYFQSRDLEVPEPAAARTEEFQPADDALLAGFDTGRFTHAPRYLGADAALPATYLVAGDSHAAHLDVGMDSAMTKAGRRAISFNNSILPVHGFSTEGYQPGDAVWGAERDKAFFSYLNAHPDIRYVIISLYWDKRVFSGKAEEWDTHKPISLDMRADCFLRGLKETCRRIGESGRKVVLVTDSPVFENPAPFASWKRYKKLGFDEYPDRFVSKEKYLSDKRKLEHFYDEMRKEGSVAALLDPSVPLFRLSEQGCPSRYKGNFIYIDLDHYTTLGSHMVCDYLVQCLLEMEKSQEAEGADTGTAH